MAEALHSVHSSKAPPVVPDEEESEESEVVEAERVGAEADAAGRGMAVTLA